MSEWTTQWQDIPGTFLVEDSMFGKASLSIIDPFQPVNDDLSSEEPWVTATKLHVPSGVYSVTVGYQECPGVKISRVWIYRPGFDYAWVPEHHLANVGYVNTISEMIYVGESHCGIEGAKDVEKAKTFEEYYDAVCAATCTNKMAACVDQAFFAFAAKSERVNVSVVKDRKDIVQAVCIDVHLHR